MSSNDPASGQQPETPPVNGSITPPPADFQPTSATDGERPPPPPGWQPEVAISERLVAQKPRWPHPNFWWSSLWCVLFLLITQIPGGLLAAVIALGLTMLAPQRFAMEDMSTQAALFKSEAMRLGLAVGMSVIGVSTIAFSLIIIRLIVGRDWTRQLAVRRPGVAHTILALASLPALMLLANVAYDVLRNVLHVPSFSDFGVGGMEEMVEVASNWPAAFAVLVIGLGPGIGEELWCRGFLARGLVGNYGVVFGVLATSFFFGFLHMDPCQGTMAMFMGLWLHFVYLTTRSLWLPMLLHFLNNSFSVLVAKVPPLKLLDAKPETIPVSVYLSAFLLLGVVAYALYQSRTRLAPQMPGQFVLWRPAYDSVEYPPPESGMQVVHPTPSPAVLVLVGGSLALLVAAFVNWAQRG